MDPQRPIELFSVPRVLPLIPVRDVVIFPGMILPLFIAREGSVQAVDAAREGERLMALVTQRDPDIDDPGPEDLFSVGTVGMIMRHMRLPDGRVKVLVQGLSKIQIENFLRSEPYIEAEVAECAPDPEVEWSVETEALLRTVREKVEDLLPLKHLAPEVLSVMAHVDEPGHLADLVASNLRLRVEEAQAILEIAEPVRRLRKVDAFLRREIAVSSVQAELQGATREEIGRSQREYFLREQLRLIQTELGETEEKGSENDELGRRIAESGMNEEALGESERQLSRLTRMHPDSSETQVVRTYLEWMVELPWKEGSKDLLDLKHAQEVLERDHAYLERVKERILEFLAVRKLRGDGIGKGPILCLVGPPGVGKTSLGRSIAQAMGRSFVRMSLGGVRDEAEIRGHRRTYVGALPGRIIQAMRQAGVINPVFVLDEIDKLGADYRGDPASAMLEVLDPEQNANFRDHYLNVPYDLSRVLFIATANLTDPIPRPLRDRMEVIRLPGYTPEEKEVIARRFLVPRQIEESGLSRDRVSLSPAAVRDLIIGYTQEAGVRGLEREIGRVLRKVARRVAEGEKERVSVTVRNLPSILGPRPIHDEGILTTPSIGVASGLAWTEAGGEVLTVEATMVRGRGLILTGQLGDVMKESGQAALSWVRWRAAELGIADALARNEIHLHVPAGAIPKDGPSAGITMAVAILSLLTENAVRADLAMTGEVTLRGRVLPVGGVREKALAALRRGLRHVILPASNEHDLDDVPPELARKMTFHFVRQMDQVVEIALCEPLVPKGRLRRTTRRAPAVLPTG